MNQLTNTNIDLNKPISEFAQKLVTTLCDTQTIGMAIEHLRGHELAEKIVYFYVVDNQNKLVGVVPVRRLLMSGLDKKISDIMIPRVISVRSTTTLLDASEMLIEKKLMALPVVDETNRLQGVFDITLFTDEISNLAHKHEIENVFQLIGVHVSAGRVVSPWVNYRERIPWLICNIIGGIVCAFIVSMHETLINMITLLAFFIPVILTLSESVSMQAMTYTLQSPLFQVYSTRMILKSVRKEIIPSIFLGLSCGIIVGGIAYIWKGNPLSALAVGVSITMAIILASLFGVLIPAAIKSFKIDPKIASGPIALAIADIATLLLFFNVAVLILD